MIRILLVDDNPNKQNSIKQIIVDNHDIADSDVEIAYCIKDARRLLYDNYFDLMILDLVLPIERNGECSALNGVKFLEEISINPSIKPPIHIVGISGYRDQVLEFHDKFKMKLWNLIEYEEASSNWRDQLDAIIFHLVKTRQKFLSSSIEKQIAVLLSRIEDENLPNTFLGSNWLSVCKKIATIVEVSLSVPQRFCNGSKAKNINLESMKIESEYDFQNLIHIILRPWIPSVEPENTAIIYDGNEKNADFSINGNAIIIEAKYISSNGKKNEVVKTLEGLKEFYRRNSNVRSLIFLILVEDSVSIDIHKLENEYGQELSDPIIFVKFFRNIVVQ